MRRSLLDLGLDERPSEAMRMAVVALVGAVVLAFGAAVGNGFVWDDAHLLVHNDAYLGAGGGQLWTMFTRPFAGHYQPLSWISFWIEARLWRLAPAGVHITNIFLHAVTAVLLMFVARRLLAAAMPGARRTTIILGAVAAATLFAVHPLRVESVAWATERRDVLSGALLMASTLLYLRMAESRRRGLLVPALLCYALSLLSKAAGMTWPVVLLVLDVYPLRRLAGGDARPTAGGETSKRRNVETSKQKEEVGGDAGSTETWAALLIEKIPFIVLAAGAAGAALWAQAASGALRTPEEHPLDLRIAQALYGLALYLGKMLWPATLLPLYEQRPEATAFDAEFVAAGAVVAAISVLAIALRRRAPWLGVCWLLYIVILAPVLGIAQSGPQVAADRYTYLPMMTWSVLAGAGLAWWWSRCPAKSRRPRVRIAGGTVLLSATLMALSVRQTLVWHDERSLWLHVVEKAPHTGMAHANLAITYLQEGRPAEARDHALRALDILPGNLSAHLTLAKASGSLRDYSTARDHLLIAQQIRPNDVSTMIRLASVFQVLGELEESVRWLKAAAEAEPKSVERRELLARRLMEARRPAEAAPYLRDVIRLDPTRLHAYHELNRALVRTGDYAGSLSVLEEGVRQAPDDVDMLRQLAWNLATLPDERLCDGPRAVTLARRALELAGGPDILASESLAAGLARSGDFAGAARIIEQLLADSSVARNPTRHDRLPQELEAYRAGRVYVLTPRSADEPGGNP